MAGEASKPPLGGINIGVASFSKKQDLAFEAAECLASEANQLVAAEKGGLAPSSTAVYDKPALKKAFPFSDLLQESIEDGGPRPVTPAYADISLAVQKTYHPPADVDPATVVEELSDRIDRAVEGGIFCWRRRACPRRPRRASRRSGAAPATARGQSAGSPTCSARRR